MENKDTNKANPVFGARAGLAKPPRLPFPTGKSGSVSHWNQRSNIPTGLPKPAAKATLKVAPSTLTGFGSAVPKPNPVVQKKRDRAMDMDMDMQDASECSGSASESMLSRNRPRNSKFGDTADSLLGSSPLDLRLMNSPPMEKIRKTSAMDCGETTEHLLPCSETCRDALKRITPETLADVLEGKYQTVFEEYVIIDCRYPYEYAGGHIRGAQNVNTTAVLESKFFPIPTCKPRVVIFHCEFSAQRAPRMGLHLRNHDRNVNISEYPYLDYPQMYILEGGYEAFHKKFQGHCSPDGYIAMNDPAYKKELEQCSALQKREFKRCYSTGFFRT
ncbi:Rhodanese-like protein [Rhizoclosmatium globosum]|uniref:M-phase inducer phosphatase n=1 Tax=Rhizoclosmatium globosum TaxID=329046 RepID=A0A1Y2BQ79_9FUNG|nr:Rhodanese-like protein [Rhizoclosmatium globosum]|eukprot:ORY36315.1 Rhodanese-like protein [Rhizoclosmatium globosum]